MIDWSHLNIGRYEYVTYCIILPLFLCVGLVFNAILLKRFLCQSFKVKAYRFLKYSTFWDLCLSILIIFYPILDKYGKAFGLPFFQSYSWTFFTAKFAFVLKNFFSRVSVLNILLLAIDRYLILSFTTKYLTWRNTKLFKTSPVLVVVFTLALCLPITHWYEVTNACVDKSHLARSLDAANISGTLVYDIPLFNKSLPPAYRDNNVNTTLNYEGHPFLLESIKPEIPYITSNCSGRYKRVRTYGWSPVYKAYSFIRELLLSLIPTVVLLFLTLSVLLTVLKLANTRKTQPFTIQVFPSGKVHPISTSIFNVVIFRVTFGTLGSNNIRNICKGDSQTSTESAGGLFKIPAILEEEFWLTVLLIVAAGLHILCIIPISVMNVIYTIKIVEATLHPRDVITPTNPQSGLQESIFYNSLDIVNMLELIKPCLNSFAFLIVCPRLKSTIPPFPDIFSWFKAFYRYCRVLCKKITSLCSS
ncbi:unnamed protein product [Gordionus sp. m RMFG-2023]